MMRDIFKDKSLQDQFAENGYVIIHLLNKDEISYLGEQYLLNNQSLPNSFFSTLFSKDSELKKRTDELIKSVIGSKLDSILIDYIPIISNFVVKHSGPDSIMHPHQDWSFVNEEEFVSLNVWFPISQASLKEGSLHVYPKSNKWPKTFRGTNIESAVSTIFNDLPINKMTELKVSPGSAVIYDHRLIHASPPNITNEPRIAAAIVYIPKESNLIHYCKQNDELLVYKIDPSFFYKYTYVSQNGNTIPSEYEVYEKLKFVSSGFDKKKLEKESGFWNKLKSFFN
jgi:hypothetical protein